MKKLMIAAAIVCAAVYAQAATFTWGSSDLNVYDWNGDGAPGVGSVAFYVDSGTGFDLITTSTAFDGDGYASFDGIDLNNGDVVKAVATLTNFADGSGTMEWVYTFTDAWYNTQPGADEASAALVNQLNAALDNGGIDFSKTAAQNGYTPVPEPTSGLLLLLGVAGLALRRRRA